MKPVDNKPNYEVVSYYQLRQFIGILGISLPFVLIFGARIFGHCDIAQPSISHYYYSIMHIVFVGVLCVLGGFLITYKGNTDDESRVSNAAGFFAFCVAIFPTAFNDFQGEGGSSCQFITLLTANPENEVPKYVSWLHFGSAALLFTCFVIFCLKFFQKQDDPNQGGFKKDRRNRVYTICGYVIAASILAIAAITGYDKITKQVLWPNYIYWFETTALIPFGFSWLLKGSVDWPKSKYKVKRNIIQYFR